MADDLKSPLLGSFGRSNGHPPPAQVGVEHGHIISRGVSPRGDHDSPQGFHEQMDLTGAEYSSGDGGSPRPEYFGNVGVQIEDQKEVPDLENGECEVKVTTGPASVGPIIESLDYEINENQIYKEHRDRVAGYRWQYVLLKWAFAFIIGLGTALTAFAINLGVENAAGAKFILLFKFIRAGHVWLSLVVYTLVNFGLVLVSSLLVAYVAPAAAGSGIPEVKSYLNGNDIPEILSLRTLATKIVGSVGSVGGGLAVGKEGPLVHTGAGIAALLGQGGSKKWGMTWQWLRLFKNDRDRRDLVTCGAAAGVAAAFRAPIGGVLFAMEEAASWLSSHLLWRVFFTTAVVSVTIKAAMGWCSKPGACGLFGAGGFILFSEPAARHGYTFFELLPTAVIGVTGGLLGALFNTLNCKVTMWRRNTLAPRGKRYQVAEAAVVSLLTSLVGFSFALLGHCKACPDPATHPEVTCPRRSGHFGNFVNFNCASQTGEYNPLATLFLSTNDDAIRNLFSTNTPLEYPPRSLLLFFAAFYCLAIITYGVAVPSGLFVPAILSGATYGRLMGVMLTQHFGPELVDEGRYALIGAASFLGGSMRMTVSLCVILLELTDQLSLLPLVMFVLLISKSVGDKFTKGIYDAHILLKKVPFLEEKPEHYMRNITAYQAASKKLVTLLRVEKVRRIMQVLSSCHHNSFPVIDRSEGAEEHFSGLILRHTLLVLLSTKQDFQRSPKIRRLDTVMGSIHGGRIGAGAGGPTHDTYNDFAKPGSGKMLRIQDVALTEDEMEHYIDLAPFLNPAPFVVQEHMSLTKVYNLFRQLGRRHLAVIPAPQRIVGIITRKDLLPERLEALFPEAIHHHHLQ